MLHGRETWCLGQSKIGILQRTERAIVRRVCGSNSGQEVNKRSNADVGLEGNNRSSGKG